MGQIDWYPGIRGSVRALGTLLCMSFLETLWGPQSTGLGGLLG